MKSQLEKVLRLVAQLASEDRERHIHIREGQGSTLRILISHPGVIYELGISKAGKLLHQYASRWQGGAWYPDYIGDSDYYKDKDGE